MTRCDDILRLIDGVLAAIEADQSDGGDATSSKPEAVAERGDASLSAPVGVPSPPSVSATA